MPRAISPERRPSRRKRGPRTEPSRQASLLQRSWANRAATPNRPARSALRFASQPAARPCATARGRRRPRPVSDGRAGIWADLLHGQTLEEILQKQGTLGAHEAVGARTRHAHGGGLPERRVREDQHGFMANYDRLVIARKSAHEYNVPTSVSPLGEKWLYAGAQRFLSPATGRYPPGADRGRLVGIGTSCRSRFSSRQHLSLQFFAKWSFHYFWSPRACDAGPSRRGPIYPHRG